MSRGNTKYNLIAAKLNANYDCSIRECYEHPEYLKTVLKEVYDGEYRSIVEEIKLNMSDLANEKDIAEFFKNMEN